MGRAINPNEVDGLGFVPVRGKALTPGYYVGRRRTWGPEAAWHVVFVYTLDEGGTTYRGVFQVGSTEPEDPRDWLIRSRVMGLEDLPPVLPPHPRVQLAEVVH